MMGASRVVELGWVTDVLGELGVGDDERGGVLAELSGYRTVGITCCVGRARTQGGGGASR